MVGDYLVKDNTKSICTLSDEFLTHYKPVFSRSYTHKDKSMNDSGNEHSKDFGMRY